MIYITQCKCPHEHCIVAVAWESENAHEDAAEKDGWQRTLADKVREAVEAGIMNAYCGLCHSREFVYTSHLTRWETIEEAAPYLYELERRQLVTAAILGPINDVKRKNSN